jgi:putative hydrolase of HD superfamily
MNIGPDSGQEEFVAVANYIHEMGQLKLIPRTGWGLAGVGQPESLADHSFRTAVIGFCLARLEGADIERTVCLCLFHGRSEARSTVFSEDEPPVAGGADISVLDIDQRTSAVVDVVAEIGEIVRDFESNESIESHLAQDADKIECLAQALEYEFRGHKAAREWANASFFAVRSKSGRSLAAALMETSPDNWWKRLGPNMQIPRP